MIWRVKVFHKSQLPPNEKNQNIIKSQTFESMGGLHFTPSQISRWDQKITWP